MFHEFIIVTHFFKPHNLYQLNLELLSFTVTSQPLTFALLEPVVRQSSPSQHHRNTMHTNQMTCASIHKLIYILAKSFTRISRSALRHLSLYILILLCDCEKANKATQRKKGGLDAKKGGLCRAADVVHGVVRAGMTKKKERSRWSRRLANDAFTRRMWVLCIAAAISWDSVNADSSSFVTRLNILHFWINDAALMDVCNLFNSIISRYNASLRSCEFFLKIEAGEVCKRAIRVINWDWESSKSFNLLSFISARPYKFT